jgi:hypothetical protein
MAMLIHSRRRSGPKLGSRAKGREDQLVVIVHDDEDDVIELPEGISGPEVGAATAATVLAALRASEMS